MTATGELLMSGRKVASYHEGCASNLSHFQRDSPLGKAFRKNALKGDTDAPVTMDLAAKSGYSRALRQLSLEDLLSEVFHNELLDTHPFRSCGLEQDERHKKEGRARLNRFLAGFVPGDQNSFRSWLLDSLPFVGERWLLVPVGVILASTQEALKDFFED